MRKNDKKEKSKPLSKKKEEFERERKEVVEEK